MQFWFLLSPRYSTDYKDTYVNGKIEYPYLVPKFVCPKCGETPSGSTLALECPEHLRETFRRGPEESISYNEYVSLCSLLGMDNGTERLPSPGFLRPGFFDVPSKPEFSFLWPSGTVLISEDTLEIIRKYSSCLAFQVFSGHVGNVDPQCEPSPPKSGEPEDLIPKASADPDSRPLPYYELVAPLVEISDADIDLCKLCGTRSTSLGDGFWEEFEFQRSHRWWGFFDADQWIGEHIFSIGVATRPVISDELRIALEAANCTNYDTVPCPAKDAYDQAFAEFNEKRKRPWWRFW